MFHLWLNLHVGTPTFLPTSLILLILNLLQENGILSIAAFALEEN